MYYKLIKISNALYSYRIICLILGTVRPWRECPTVKLIGAFVSVQSLITLFMSFSVRSLTALYYVIFCPVTYRAICPLLWPFMPSHLPPYMFVFPRTHLSPYNYVRFCPICRFLLRHLPPYMPISAQSLTALYVCFFLVTYRPICSFLPSHIPPYMFVSSQSLTALYVRFFPATYRPICSFLPSHIPPYMFVSAQPLTALYVRFCPVTYRAICPFLPNHLPHCMPVSVQTLTALYFCFYPVTYRPICPFFPVTNRPKCLFLPSNLPPYMSVFALRVCHPFRPFPRGCRRWCRRSLPRWRHVCTPFPSHCCCCPSVNIFIIWYRDISTMYKKSKIQKKANLIMIFSISRHIAGEQVIITIGNAWAKIAQFPRFFF